MRFSMAGKLSRSFKIALIAALASNVLSAPDLHAEMQPVEVSKHDLENEFREVHQHIVHRRFKLAAERARLMAVRGHAKAQAVMGMLYQHGLGVEKDIKVAIYWLEKAADQELREAESYLGHLYLEGKFVEKDLEKAEMWLLKAAKHGEREAQLHLGLMYLDDKWVKKDVKSGEVWLRAAALQDSEEAKQALEKIPGVNPLEKRTKESESAYSQGLYSIKDSWAGYGDIINSIRAASAGASDSP